jgi:hypothetical protein
MPDSDYQAVRGEVEEWFANLERIRRFLSGENLATPSSLLKFSNTQLQTLLINETIAQNLWVFCQGSGIGVVGDEIRKDRKQPFDRFLDIVSGSASARVRRLFERVAKLELNPPFAGSISTQTLGAVFGNAPLDTNAALKQLDRQLTLCVPPEFYPTGGSLLSVPSQIIRQVITDILK